MRYLISTNEDIVCVSECVKESDPFDIIIFWENGTEAVEIERIHSTDQIIVALRDAASAALICEYLRQKGVDACNLIDFYRVYDMSIPAMKADRVMQNPFREQYEGIILGISHAEVGILAEALEHPAANLAVSSQDLFYNYMTLKYVFEHYGEKLCNLQYLIIDMYKYNYFNFDVSKSKMAYPYYSMYGGFVKHPHNFCDNHNFRFSFEEMCDHIAQQHLMGITEEQLEIWESLFYVSPASRRPQMYENTPDIHKRNRIVTDDIINTYNYSPSNVIHRFEDTIRENCRIFEDILALAREFYPDIRIYVLQMPLLKESWDIAREFYLPWKEEFERIIREAQKKYDFDYWDMTEHELSKNRLYWTDTEHLNYLGAIRFTEYLNDLI